MFMVIGFGYALGGVNIRGFSLGAQESSVIHVRRGDAVDDRAVMSHTADISARLKPAGCALYEFA